MVTPEIHIHIHGGDLDLSSEPITIGRRRRLPRTEIRSFSDIQTSMAENIWKKNLVALFLKGLPVWYHLQGSRIDELSGGSNDSNGLEVELAVIDERIREQFSSAHGSHISKEKLVNVMVSFGARLAEQKGIEKGVIEQYLESRIQLQSEALALTQKNTAQLKSRIYQRDLESVI